MRQLVISQSITNRDSVSLAKYLQDINKVAMITPEEEADLSRRIRGGDRQALHALTVANLRFVVSVAKQYRSKDISLGDLINEGNLGLIKAAERFDETRGFKFISYAVWWIRQSIIQAITEKSGVVHVPLNQKTVFAKIQKGQAILEQQLERDASSDELASLLELSLAEVELAQRCNAPHQSLDAPLGEGETLTLVDTICSTSPASDHRVFHEQSLHLELQQAMKLLSKMEIKIICCSFGIGGPQQSVEEIGRHFKLSGERIRQLRQRALTKMRNSSKAHVLQTYLCG